MSAGAGTASTGPLAATAAAGGRRPGSPGLPGVLLGRLTVLPALVSMAWLLAGLPLLLAGRFTAVLMVALSAPLMAVLLVLGTRWIPGRWQGARVSPDPQGGRTPWWALAGVIAVAAAFGVDQAIYHSQQIIVTRDPGSYIQFGYWIAHHGSLPIPQSRAAFGGPHPGLTYASPAFYQVGTTIVPQFMAGLPMVLAAGFWAGGLATAVGTGALLGACAVLTFGGLAARLTGPRWAPLAALVLAVGMPEQYTSRATFSEPLAQILFFGGLCLVIDSLEAGSGGRVLAALGGLALGLVILARIDGASDILPVIPYCGLLLIGHKRQALPLLGGVAAGAAFGIADGVLLSLPYLVTIASSLVPLVLVVVAAVIVTAVAVAALRRRGLPRLTGPAGRWLLAAATVLPFALMIFFAVRPHLDAFHPTRSDLRHPDQISHPLANWLFDLSLHWVIWYIGVPAVILGTFGAALLARRCLQGRAPSWTLAYMVFAWIIVTVLYRPAIIPQQPWASRRLVPGVIPGLILMAVWGAHWLVVRIRRDGYPRTAVAGVIALASVVLLLPAAMTTYGLGLRSGGPLGVRLTADSMAFKSKLSGEVAAVHRLCGAIPRGASVVIVNPQTGRQYAQVVRGMCGDPTAIMDTPSAGPVQAVLRGISRAGRRPVLMAASRGQLAPYGGTIRQVLSERPLGDGGYLTTPPLGIAGRVRIIVWLSEPAS